MRKRLICTTAGNTLTDRESFTYLRVAGSAFTPQKAKNIKRGDMVLFYKEYVDKTLGEVEEYLLAEDARYHDAKDALFERNRAGVYVPRLRTGLWRGAPKKTRAAYENLEAKVLLEEGDFNDYEYRDMNRRIQVALSEHHAQGGPLPVTSTASKNWLVDTVAPADWNMFEALANINPVFGNFLEHFRNSNENSPDFSNNIYDAYKLFIGIRQGIMRYIASPKNRGIGGVEGDGAGRTRFLSLKPEIDIILKYVLDEIDDSRIAVAVTGVKDIEYEVGRGFDTGGIKISAGVLNGRSPEGVSVKSFGEIEDDFGMIDFRLMIAINEYVQKRLREEGVSDPLEREYCLIKIDSNVYKKRKISEALPTLVRHARKNTFEESGKVSKEKEDELIPIIERVTNELEVGPSLVSKVEARFYLPEAVKFDDQRIKLLPLEWYQYYEQLSKMYFEKPSGENFKKIKKKINKLKKTLKEEYLCDLNKSRMRRVSLPHITDSFLRQRKSKGISLNVPVKTGALEEYAEQKGRIIVWPEEEKAILEQYGLGFLFDSSWI